MTQVSRRGREAELRNKEDVSDGETRRQRMTLNLGDAGREDGVDRIGLEMVEGRNLEERREKRGERREERGEKERGR